MSDARPPVLCVSGAGLPAWIWDAVRRELGNDEADAVAARPDSADASLDDYVQAAVTCAPPGEFVIVAHSGGGVIGAEVARRVPERVGGFLGLSAVIPPPGGSFLSAVPAPQRWVLSAVMRVAGTRPPESAIRRELASGLDDEATGRIIDDFEPESPHYYRDPTGDAPLPGHLGYVCTTADRAMAPTQQRGFASRLSASWQRDLDTGHLPMLEQPRAVAALVTEFVAARP